MEIQREDGSGCAMLITVDDFGDLTIPERRHRGDDDVYLTPVDDEATAGASGIRT